MKLLNVSVLFLIQLATSSVIIRELEPSSRELHSRSSSGDVDILGRKSKRSSSKKQSKKQSKKRSKKRSNKKTKKPTSSPTTVQSTLPDIVETALAAGNFTTLIATITAADLVETLSAPNGPYTVFAPTDDAIGLLPNGIGECLLRPENVDPLTSILLYHVLDGIYLSSDLPDGTVVTTLNGEDLIISGSWDGITADVLTSNGVMHILGAILFPPSIDIEAFLATC